MLTCNYSAALVTACLAASALFASCTQQHVTGPMSPPGGAATEPADTHSRTATPAGDAADGEATTKTEGDAANDTAAPAPSENPNRPAPGANPAKPAETRTVEVIQQVFLSHRPEVRECYEKGLKKDPSLKGDLVVSFVLSSRGKLKFAELNRARSTLVAPAVVECALSAIAKFEFPPSSLHMETSGNYPFNFVP